MAKGVTMDNVTLTREQFNMLKLNVRKLRALEAAGVDNWEGYDIAMDSLAEETIKNERQRIQESDQESKKTS